MREHISLLVLLTSACFAHPQAMPEAPNHGPTSQEPMATSETYNDTHRTVKKWVESDENNDLARWLAIGEGRIPDLVAACHGSDEEIVEAAFGALQLLGKAEGETCADSVSQIHGGMAVTCSANISEVGLRTYRTVASQEAHSSRMRRGL